MTENVSILAKMIMYRQTQDGGVRSVGLNSMGIHRFKVLCAETDIKTGTVVKGNVVYNSDSFD